MYCICLQAYAYRSAWMQKVILAANPVRQYAFLWLFLALLLMTGTLLLFLLPYTCAFVVVHTAAFPASVFTVFVRACLTYMHFCVTWALLFGHIIVSAYLKVQTCSLVRGSRSAEHCCVHLLQGKVFYYFALFFKCIFSPAFFLLFLSLFLSYSYLALPSKCHLLPLFCCGQLSHFGTTQRGSQLNLVHK